MRKFRVIKKYPGGPKVGTIMKEHPDTIHDKGPLLYHNHSWIYPLDWPQHFEEVREPLFTTKDGVDIFGGDEYYLIMGNRPLKTEASSQTDYEKEEVARFANYQNAITWLKENQPIYSLNDVKKAIKEITHHDEDTFANRVIEQMKKYRDHKK